MFAGIALLKGLAPNLARKYQTVQKKIYNDKHTSLFNPIASVTKNL